MEKIDKADIIPRYHQLKEILRNQILSQDLLVGDKLPAERKLMQKYGLSQATVRQALSGLVQEGLLYREQGKGTFVLKKSGNLPKENTYNIGAVIFDIDYITHPSMSQLLKGMGDVSNRHHYNLQIFATKKRTLRKNLHLCFFDIIPKNQVDGLLVILQQVEKKDVLTLQEQIPFVLVKNYIPDMNLNAVIIDYSLGISLAMEHLIKLGHNKIGFIHGPKGYWITKDMLKGYKSTLEKYGLNFDRSLLKEGEFTEKRGFELADELFNLQEKPTAVLAGDDAMAAGIIKKAKERELRVPGDLAVIGFNDMPLASLMKPAITTLRVPIYEMGKAAGEILFKLICKEKVTEGKVVFKPELIVRESCGAKSEEISSEREG